MSEMFNIVKGHPIPPVTRNRSTAATKRRKYPIEGMEVGDSFFVPNRTVRRVSAYISRITSKLPSTFSSRPGWGSQDGEHWLPAEAETSGATQGTWVWRTK